ncbi:MAG: YafY family transcriptional regulator [Rhodocyclaceae bacterium]|nr:YafY family transcriptional regulator [Rhodocyclaceae bacterium]
MDRTERFYKIDQMIHERTLVSFAQLQEALEVSRATLKRDLEYMRNRLNAPILWDREAGGYRFEQSTGASGASYELPGLWFNANEVHALLTMQHLLENLAPGGILTPHIQPLMARLNNLLGASRHSAEEVRRRVLIVAATRRTLPLAHFEKIGSALLGRRRLQIRYFARGSGATTEREISPQRLVHYRENWYLDAWCHLRNEVRNFAADSILHLDILASPAREVSAQMMNASLGPGYGIIANGKVQWARLRFTPERARWVAQETWHADQRGKVDAQGNYVLEVPFSDHRELIMDILRYGADVEVLAPPTLRARVAGEATRLMELYSR